jgi:3-hydroxybutyrate dehydrogenase
LPTEITQKMLKGKAAIVTGSTSGIGLGIAQSLAAAGCNVMLNGFGDAQAIERERIKLTNEFGVRAAFHPAVALDQLVYAKECIVLH